jgi:phosphonoacetaldehyde hydrolase
LLDWAGTTVDHGSLAPALAFVELFRQRGVEITTYEARGPMGQAKRDHIAAILAGPRVRQLWVAAHGRPPDDSDVQALNHAFLPIQRQILATHSAVIPGVANAVLDLKKRDIKIGSTTGYSRELMDIGVPIAAAGGYSPEVVVCAEDVRAGRPAPWMNFRAAELLGLYPLSAVLVADDTPVGIQAGRNVGAVTVAVLKTGNSLGLSEQELAALSPEELVKRLAAIRQEFLACGADAVVESVADLPALLEG